MKKNPSELDLTEIAKIEKAVKEKYGELAIQNPLSFWDEKKEEEYIEQLKKIYYKDLEKSKKHYIKPGFLRSRKLFKESDRICPNCGVYSFFSRDDIYYIKYECCYECYIKYVEGPGREEKWLKKIGEKRNGKIKSKTEKE